MQIEKALKLLGLPPNPSLPALLAAYRKRAKKYHPDFHPKQQEKAHRVMVLLNSAYNLILNTYCLEDPFPPSETGIPNVQTETSTGLTPAFSLSFNKYLNILFQGMLTYYQYGLENVYLRNEGSRRINYRKALRQIHTGLNGMLKTKPLVKSNDDKELYDIFTVFGKTFYQSTRMNKRYIPGTAREEKPYRHYARGARLLDIALRNEFFGPYFNTNKGVTANTTVINHELMTVITRYAVSDWAGEAVIRLFLLDQFKQVMLLYQKHNHAF
jgi:hypothetical protein